jgi:hypothetical protein
MKAAIVQQAAPTSLGTQDYTDAQFASDLKCAMFFMSRATANNTSSADNIIGIGMTDLVTDAWSGFGSDDGVATGDFGNRQDTGICAGRHTGDTSARAIGGTTSGQSHPATGVRVNWTTVDTASLCNALLLGGADVSAKVVAAPFTNAAAPEAVVVTHSLGVTPTFIVCVTANNANAGVDARDRISFGIYNVAANTYVVHATNTSGTTSISPRSYIDTDCIAAQDGTSGTDYEVTISSVGTTSFTMTASGQNSDEMQFLVVYVANSFSATALANLATSGATTLISGLAGQPTLVFTVLSRRTTTGHLANSDAAGAFGVGVAVDGEGNFCITGSTDQQSTTTSTVEKCQTSNTQSIRILDTAGAADVEGTITYTADGATTTPTNFSASILKLGVFALGVSAAAPLAFAGPNIGDITGTTGVAITPVDVSAKYSGGTPPYTYTFVGTPQTGISIASSTGIISGTGTQTGVVSSLEIRATDAVAATIDSNPFSITISGIGSAGSPVHGTASAITGTGFGAAQGSGSVKTAGQTQAIASWSDTSISVNWNILTHLFGQSLLLEVLTNGGTTFSSTVTLTQPAGQAYTTLDQTLAEAGQRITAIPDLMIGGQIWYYDLLDGNGVSQSIALVTINGDGTVDLDDSVATSADNPATLKVKGNNGDGAGWGAEALQELGPISDAITLRRRARLFRTTRHVFE